jgi:hypothetical protein
MVEGVDDVDEVDDDESSGDSSVVDVLPTPLSAEPTVDPDGRSKIPIPTITTAATAASAASRLVRFRLVMPIPPPQ